MKEASARVVWALLALTFVTGLIDAASVLGLGHVFVANMTGNVVFIGFGLFGQGAASLGAGLCALLGFSCGAVIGGRLMRGSGAGRLPTALTLEVLALATAGALAALWPAVDLRFLILLMASALGLRTAVVRALAVPDLTTTVLTLTLAGIAADSNLAGGTNPRLARRLASVGMMLAGASLGAVLFWSAARYVVLIAAGLEACAAWALATGVARDAPAA